MDLHRFPSPPVRPSSRDSPFPPQQVAVAAAAAPPRPPKSRHRESRRGRTAGAGFSAGSRPHSSNSASTSSARERSLSGGCKSAPTAGLSERAQRSHGASLQQLEGRQVNLDPTVDETSPATPDSAKELAYATKRGLAIPWENRLSVATCESSGDESVYFDAGERLAGSSEEDDREAVQRDSPDPKSLPSSPPASLLLPAVPHSYGSTIPTPYRPPLLRSSLDSLTTTPLYDHSTPISAASPSRRSWRPKPLVFTPNRISIPPSTTCRHLVISNGPPSPFSLTEISPCDDNARQSISPSTRPLSPYRSYQHPPWIPSSNHDPAMPIFLPASLALDPPSPPPSYPLPRVPTYDATSFFDYQPLSGEGWEEWHGHLSFVKGEATTQAHRKPAPPLEISRAKDLPGPPSDSPVLLPSSSRPTPAAFSSPERPPLLSTTPPRNSPTHSLSTPLKSTDPSRSLSNTFSASSIKALMTSHRSDRSLDVRNEPWPPGDDGKTKILSAGRNLATEPVSPVKSLFTIDSRLPPSSDDSGGRRSPGLRWEPRDPRAKVDHSDSAMRSLLSSSPPRPTRRLSVRSSQQRSASTSSQSIQGSQSTKATGRSFFSKLKMSPSSFEAATNDSASKRSPPPRLSPHPPRRPTHLADCPSVSPPSRLRGQRSSNEFIPAPPSPTTMAVASLLLAGPPGFFSPSPPSFRIPNFVPSPVVLRRPSSPDSSSSLSRRGSCPSPRRLSRTDEASLVERPPSIFPTRRKKLAKVSEDGMSSQPPPADTFPANRRPRSVFPTRKAKKETKVLAPEVFGGGPC